MRRTKCRHAESTKRAADGRKQRSRKIVHEEREKYRAKNGSLQITSTDFKESTFVILKNHASALIRKKRLSSTSKARREASQNEFLVKDTVKSFLKINSSEDHPGARPGFVKLILDRLRKNKICSRVGCPG